MNCFTSVLWSRSDQPLSRDRKATVRGLTDLVVSCREGAIYKGTETDTIVQHPARIVKRLVDAGLLPKNALVQRCEFPGRTSFKRSALFRVSFTDLAKRSEAIHDFIDFDCPTSSPLDGRQTVILLTEMIAHAAVVAPEYYQDDAMLRGLFNAVKEPSIFRALTSGASTALSDWANLLKESS